MIFLHPLIKGKDDLVIRPPFNIESGPCLHVNLWTDHDRPVQNHNHSNADSVCYASAFRRRRHYVFGLSVRPSVRSLKYPLLTCTWVRWSTRPMVTVLRHVRPSVCPSVRPSVRRGFRAFAGERMEGLAWNFTCWCILTIFRTDKFMAVVCWFF